MKWPMTKRPCNFYPRPPRGGRPRSRGALASSRIFLSTPSARRATAVSASSPKMQRISIHALREEGDSRGSGSNNKMGDFYPRPPRGGRPQEAEAQVADLKFLSTPSARRATASWAMWAGWILISIHALREEGDPTTMPPSFGSMDNFYPRPPRGGRRPYRSFLPGCRYFYPRPPRGGRPFYTTL